MDVYAEAGASLQQVGGDCPDGWVVMQGERPTPEYVAQEDGSWVADPRAKLAANNAAYTEATDALTADYPQLEKDTWPTQNEEASAWVADPSGAATPWIDRAAAERGLDREEYIRRTLIKARQFKVMSAFLTGRRQRYEDQIKAGNNPVLDYALTPEVLIELQQITETIMSTPAAGLQEALA